MRSACLLLLFVAIHASTALAEINAGTMNRLKSCDPAVTLAATKELLRDPTAMQELTPIFNAAYFMYGAGKKDEAVFWFYAGQLRFRYSSAVKPVEHAKLLSDFMTATGHAINNYAFQDVAKLDRIFDDVLAWDKATPNPMKEFVTTPEIEAAVRKVYEGLDEYRAKLRTNKEVEKAAKAAANELQWQDRVSREMDCVGPVGETLDGTWGTEKFRLYLVQRENRICGEHSDGGPRSVVGSAPKASANIVVSRPDGFRMRVMIRRVNDTLEWEFPAVLKKGEGGDPPLAGNLILARRSSEEVPKRVVEDCNKLFDSVKW